MSPVNPIAGAVRSLTFDIRSVASNNRLGFQSTLQKKNHRAGVITVDHGMVFCTAVTFVVKTFKFLMNSLGVGCYFFQSMSVKNTSTVAMASEMSEFISLLD